MSISQAIDIPVDFRSRARRDGMDDVLEETRERLVRWAAWARCPLPGSVRESLGYMRERLDKEHDGEPTEEIAITDKAVAQLYVHRKQYKPAFNRFYLDPAGLSEYEISMELGWTIERVKAVLRQSEIFVAQQLKRLEKA